LIMLWIQYEMGYDRFHEKKDRIYEVWNRVNRNGEISCWNTTPRILGPTLKKDFPEVEHAVRVDWENSYLFSVGEKQLMAKGNAVDSNFLEVFSFSLLKGNPKTVLSDPSSIVLTEKLAKRIFGDDDPMGKVVMLENKYNFKVSGIIQDQPSNTRFEFEYLLPWSFLRQVGGDDTYWGNNSTRNYVLLKPNTSVASLDPKLKSLRKKYDPDDPEAEMFMYPMERWRLYSRFENGKESGGMIEFVRLFAIIAAFILLIACINFMNLSTARSEKRAREVGIRKVAGAQKKSLVAQFLGESILVALIAGMIGLALVELVLPAFGRLTNRVLHIQYSDAGNWGMYIAFILFTGLVAGSYPAFFLSSFQPIRVLKGAVLKVNSGVTPRKVLVILQFTFAIILTIGTIIIRQQIKYAQERQTGYNKDNLVYHFLTGDLDKNYMLVKNELLSKGIATSVTKTSAPMTEGWSNSWGFQWAGKQEGDKRLFDRFCADDKLAATAGLQIIQGRDLDLGQFPTDSQAILLNESAVKAMGFKDPIGQIIKDDDRSWHVVGVFRDFILQSPYRKTEPMVVEGASGWFNVMHIKLNGARGTADNLKQMETVFRTFNPSFPFDAKFVDNEYARKFENEQRTGKLVSVFTILTILISCLGLFGLATYMAEARIKEIGVRKVLGASVSGITALLSKDFLKLVGIALLIAIPVAWWAMHAWLEKFEYRVEIQWWYFALAGVSAILIALFTVSYQALKAGLSNPVKSLRSE
ncbi:MAG: ABC transporter permease, partial [Chitinophagaceae bacterium]|nr:ABC transporter permease [Chitinophagaceae bacterium]